MATPKHILNKVRPSVFRPLDGSLFAWKGNEGYCDVSDLPGPGFPEERLFHDACDCGFVVRSHRTGNDELFFFVAEHLDNERELLYHQYSSYGGEFTIKIFND